MHRTPYLHLLLCLLGTLLLSLHPAHAESQKAFTLVIDPGHGGRDPGAISKKIKEKDINLSVALEVGRLLKANCPHVKVVYTRKTDIYLSLKKRAEIANRNKADLFISIHTNALPGGKIAYGTETYSLGMARAAENLEVAKRENSVITYEDNYQQTYDGFDPSKAESYIIFELLQDKYMKESVELARCIQQQYKKAGRKSRGVHQAGLLVLRETSMPAVLTELGFISTPEERHYMNSRQGIQTFGRCIYNGIMNYMKTAGRTAGATLPPAPVLEETANPVPEESPKTDTPAASKKKPVQPETPASDTRTETVKGQNAPTGTATKAERPVFKVQLFVTDRKLKANDKRLKGQKNISFYREKGLYKYTCGASENYSEIRQLQKTVGKKFPGTFIVAFLNDRRIDLNEAIKMAKTNNRQK